MQKPEQQADPAPLPIAERWRRVRSAYRVCNLATHHVLGFTVKLALLLYFAFTIVFLLLRYAILPNIDYYKGNIEQLASRALGSQVSIARIYASWRGLRPNLFLGDVTLRDDQGRQVLSLPSVSATVSWWSVLAGEPRFDSLDIIRPDLEVRRDAQGRLFVAGIPIVASKEDDGAGSDWLFKQREIVIREGRVRWTDQQRGAPVLALADLHLVLRNRWTHHRFALRATPPASLSGPLDVRADFVHPRFGARAADVAHWKGELYADLRDTDLAGWKAYTDYPFQIDQGRGSVRAWVSLDKARLAGFTADLGLVDVAARLDPALPPLALARVQGRLSARETASARQVQAGKPLFGAGGHAISVSNFSLTTADGLSLAPATLSETYQPARAGQPAKVDVSASLLDLETLAKLAAQLPLTPAQRALLAELGLRGKVSDLSLQLRGTYPAVAGYRVKARLDGLGMQAQPARAALPKSAGFAGRAAVPAIPGFANLSGSIDASDQGGNIAIDASNLLLQLPSLFAEAELGFEQLLMRARWSFAPRDQLLFELDSLQFVHGKIKGSLSGKHQMALVAAPGKGAGNIDLNGSVSGFELATIGRYLPLQTPPHLREWLTGALEAGVAQDATIRLRGDLAHFPFRGDTAAERARGEFRIAGRLENARLNYAPGHFAADGKSPQWPQADLINGSFAFDRARMEIKGDTARTLGLGLSNVKATIADLADPNKILEIDGSAAGPLQEMLHYVAASPVLGWIGHFTESTQATGNAKLGLKLQLPLAHLVDAKVQGSLALMNNDVVLFEPLPPLQSAIGKIEFNERGVSLNGVGASFLGGPLAVTGGSTRDNAIVIRLGGTLSSDGVRRQYPSAAMLPVTSRLAGSTRYTGAITVRDHQLQVMVDSTLAGMALDFPAPGNKTADTALPLHFVLTGAAPAEGERARDEIKIAVGNLVNARYLRQRNAKGAWKVLSGGVGVNLPAPEPDSGMMVNVNMKSLNVDHWLALASAVSAAPKAAPAPGAEDGIDLAEYVVPDVMAARANELIIGERKLDNVVVGASHQKDTWQASIDSRQASGHISWAEGAGGQGLGRVTARLATLVIPESEAAEVKDLLENKSAAASIPALDIVADRFELFNRQLGRLELVASNGRLEPQAAAGREWRIDRLSLATPEGLLRSTGKWVWKDGQSNTSLNFTLDIDDAGKLLERVGFPETVRRGKGKLSGAIAWNGLPYSLDIPSLSGQIDLNIASGQFLKQDPGAAKLLGVLSLQMLPRLLKLDFHDVFSEGLAFDGISARAAITRGVVRTDNLKMWGVAATVLMDGTADIANESTNLHVVVIPEFNLGTGPLVYALAVNPVVGIGSFLAQLFLRAPVMRALTYEMQVTGPWKAPVITKLAGARAAAQAAQATQATPGASVK